MRARVVASSLFAGRDPRNRRVAVSHKSSAGRPCLKVGGDVEFATCHSEVYVSPKKVADPVIRAATVLPLELDSSSANGSTVKPASASAEAIRRMVRFYDERAKLMVKLMSAEDVFFQNGHLGGDAETPFLVHSGVLAPLGEESWMESMDRRDAEDAERVADAADGKVAEEGNYPEDEEVFRDDDGAIYFESQSGEERRFRCLPVPTPPSQEAVRRHNLTHCPFRPWC